MAKQPGKPGSNPNVAFAFVKGGDVTFDIKNSETKVTNGSGGTTAGFVTDDAKVKVKMENSTFDVGPQNNGSSSTSSNGQATNGSQERTRPQENASTSQGATGSGVQPESDRRIDPSKSTRLKIKLDDGRVVKKQFSVDTYIEDIIKIVQKECYGNENGQWIFIYNGKQISIDETLDDVGIYDTVVKIERISS